MARDAELDRLKNEQDNLFERKQRAWEKQNDAWKNVEALRSRYGSRIDYLNQEQQRLYESMKYNFERASDAFRAKDHDGAKSYSSQGNSCKNQLPAIIDERRRLVAELKAAGAIQKQAAEEFRSIKAEYEQANQRFKARLEVIKSQNQRKKDDERNIASRAGVPIQYRDDIRIRKGHDGTIQIYFGGVGKPDGPGHGHYTMDSNGKVTHNRDPWEPHGPQNFTDSQRDYFSVVVSETAGKYDFGFNCQFRGNLAYVESNINRQGIRKIDIYYGPNGPFGPGHNHAVAYRDKPLEIIFDGIRS